MALNVRLMRRIKRVIMKEPSTFTMTAWACGTALCIGGHACVMSGYSLLTEDDPVTLFDGGAILPVACRVLDISEEAAPRLFAYS